MAKPGRKRKPGARYKCGKLKSVVDHGTAEFRAHRIALVGVDHATDQRAGDALGVMELAGLITASQREAGAAWGRAMRLTYGSPYPATMKLDDTPRGDSDGPPEAMQRRADDGIAAIKAASGHDGYHWVRMVCVADALPGWFRRSYDRAVDERQQQMFLLGIAALE